MRHSLLFDFASKTPQEYRGVKSLHLPAHELAREQAVGWDDGGNIFTDASFGRQNTAAFQLNVLDLSYACRLSIYKYISNRPTPA